MSDFTVGDVTLADSSKEFLLAELQESVSTGQHTDNRLDKEVQHYLTLLGAAGTVAALLFQFGNNVYLTIAVAQFLTAVIGVAGFRLLRRIIALTGLSALFDAQLALIRRCFVDMDERISPYVLLITATRDGSPHHFTPVSKQTAVQLVSTMNSLLAAMTVFLTPFYFYYYFQGTFNSATWTGLFAATGVLSLLVGGVCFWYQKRVSRHRGDKYLNDIAMVVQRQISDQEQKIHAQSSCQSPVALVRQGGA